MNENAEENIKRLIIIGAGDAGEIIAREIQKSKKLNYKIIGFVDDKPSKKGTAIHNIPILGSINELSRIQERYLIDEAIIAIPSATGKELRKIVEQCNSANITYKVTPGLFEIIDGQVSINQIREVRIEDLLGREIVNSNLISSSDIKNKVVLVTGAAGSIGSELCRQIIRYSPDTLILLDNCEYGMYMIDMEIRKTMLKSQSPVSVKTIIADVQNQDRLDRIFKDNKIDIVYHAAAYKHVPLMEHNIEEVVRNNILGTRNVIQLSDKHAVGKFVLVSTDKAVNPTNAMGASKRVCEILMQIQAEFSSTIFTAVRFGNVLGSKGSVIPLFREQIQNRGPITVTHPDITRYFMTIPEAVRLILKASSIAKGGEIFILDMGEPIKILNLARDMIHLSGLEEGKDIDIVFTGLRPGEKLYEELLLNEEEIQTTAEEKIFITKPVSYNKDEMVEKITALILESKSGDLNRIREMLFEIITCTEQNQNNQMKTA